jgi:hypothetical protein
MNIELDKLKQAMASIDDKIKVVKADMDAKEGAESEASKMFGYCYDLINGLRSYVYQIEGSFYDAMREHRVGHLPPIKGAGKLEKAMEKLGISDDYEIIKPTIYASASRNGAKQFEVTLPIKK